MCDTSSSRIAALLVFGYSVPPVIFCMKTGIDIHIMTVDLQLHAVYHHDDKLGLPRVGAYKYQNIPEYTGAAENIVH